MKNNRLLLYASLVVTLLAGCAPYEYSYEESVIEEPSPLAQYFDLPAEPVTTYSQEPSQPFAVPAYAPPRQTVVHEVGPLESLWRIAKMYDVPQENIIHTNGLTSQSLEIGQKLTVPNAAPVTPVIYLYPSNRWKFIVVHHTASDSGNARLVNQWHQNRGFDHGLGYHFLIDNGTSGKADGQIETSPRWIKQQSGAHCKAGNMNEMAIGISLVGNFSETSPTRAQMESLAFLTRELMKYYRIPKGNILAHGQVRGATTECPGSRFPWRDLQNRI